MNEATEALRAARLALRVADGVLGRDPLLASVSDVLGYSASLIKRSIPDRLRGKSYEESPEWATDVWEHVMRNPDGMTFKDNPGDGPTTGQMVSYPKKEVEEVVPFYMLLPEDLHQHFVTDHGDRINSRADNMAGGWTSGPPPFDPEDEDDVRKWGPHGPGPGPHYYMDVSRNEDDPHTMMGEALAHGQDGIFDLNPHGKGYLDTNDAFHQIYPEQPHKFWTGKRTR